VVRVAGSVRVRLAGESGSRTLAVHRPRIQTGPQGVVETGPNGVARVTFADDTIVILRESALARLGDPARGEPRLECLALTHLDVTHSLHPRLGPLELPGGARVGETAEGVVRVVRERDRFFRVGNLGTTTIPVALAGRVVWLRPSERIAVPVLRNVPSFALPPAASSAFRDGVLELRSSAGSISIGDALFPTSQLTFDPLALGAAMAPAPPAPGPEGVR
jgi:hypothetical protein